MTKESPQEMLETLRSFHDDWSEIGRKELEDIIIKQMRFIEWQAARIEELREPLKFLVFACEELQINQCGDGTTARMKAAQRALANSDPAKPMGNHERST